MAAKAVQKFKISLIQLFVGTDKVANLKNAVSKIGEAAKSGADLVVLPECFNSPYGTQFFAKYAERLIDGESIKALADAAKQNNVYVVGGSTQTEYYHTGSIPERDDDDKLFNTCVVFARDGRMIARHRKVHLFDIDVPGKITFKESETLSAGNQPTLIETEFGKIGIGICYDVRFAELARLYTRSGAQLLIYPGAFNMTTGPAHWEILAKARAVDNQCFVALCSPARDANASYVAFGNSLIVDPWGDILCRANENEAIVYADIDLERLREVRAMIPILQQRRTDIYETIAQAPLTVSK